MSETHDLTAVEALLRERDAVAGWLARLDEQGAAAPETVRDRVRRDYRDRLDGLTDRLREHADTVEARLAADRAEHDGLMARAKAAREALAEVELRHGVGEYDDERFESERRRHITELDAVEESLGAVTDRIGRLEEVHRLVTAPARPGSPSAAAPMAPETPDTLPPEAEPWPEEAPFEPDPEPAADAESPAMAIEDLAPEGDPAASDEADDLLSIFDPAGPGDEDSRSDRSSATPSFGPLSFTPSGPSGPEPGRPSRPPPPIGLPAPDQSPRFVRPGGESSARQVETGGGVRAETIRVIPDPEPILPDVPADTGNEVVARTLRCAECGAMNRPLEWYCEKCGAELTAV